MLRDAVASNSKSGIGALAKKYMSEGRLLPDDVVIEIVLERIKQRDCRERGFLLDGFPRTQRQARALAEHHVDVDAFIFLRVPRDELIRRVVGRREDPNTGKIYHVLFSPPPAHVNVVQRHDDTLESMEKRLEQFYENLDAVKRFYDNVVVEIDGCRTPDEVGDAIQDAIAIAHGKEARNLRS
mmetsp:Transcript_15147/g.23048  ORF Transcript_15147/g.23048 Transcript_15147/m.23048 type:complete len:183 (-) Transcript_15147:705-1253(-)